MAQKTITRMHASLIHASEWVPDFYLCDDEFPFRGQTGCLSQASPMKRGDLKFLIDRRPKAEYNVLVRQLDELDKPVSVLHKIAGRISWIVERGDS